MPRLISVKSKDGIVCLINPDHITYVHESKEDKGCLVIHITDNKHILVEKELDHLRLDINNALNPPL